MKYTTKNKDWYKDSLKTIKNIYKSDYDFFIDLLASTSPRKNVKANYKLSYNIYLNVISGFEPFTNIKGVLKAHKNNVIRSLRGEELSGLKVQNFAKALKGDLNAVVIDVWVKRYFKIPENKALTPLQYKKLERKIRVNAKKNNLKPAEYQAVIWEKQRQKNGFIAKSFESVVKDIIR